MTHGNGLTPLTRILGPIIALLTEPHLPSKEANLLRPVFVDVKVKYQDRLRPVFVDVKVKYQDRLRPVFVDVKVKYKYRLRPVFVDVKVKYQDRLARCEKAKGFKNDIHFCI
ncbi:hypothetical protein AVEN_189615-1 [Araneus ventricosus]|uniref:Uncharacterized protein n=1 Tax=Araneus ventricosus TaxID=182803 RepID=A0A4Y2U7S0_ARAVE|nr:hypothetical protein AVEN_189615-1 [Araneus ventricosus]